MKSIKTLAYLGAVALIGMGFVACNNNDPEKTTNEARETVKTQFTLSLPQQLQGTNGARRMPGATVQADNSFRGMTDVKLLPFTLADASAVNPITGTETTTGNFFALAPVDALEATNNSKVYADVQIPVGVNAFLLYGRANDAPSDNAGWQQYGALEVTGLDANPIDLSAIEFTPKAIYTGAAPAKATAIADYLTAIVQAKTAANVTWQDVAAVDTKLGTLFNEFIKLTAGSSYSVQSVVTALYKQMNIYATEPSNTYVAVAQAVMDAIASKATVSAGDVTALDASLTNYPAELYLPDGAAAVKYASATNSFAAEVDSNVLNGDNHTALQKYAYPISLYYFANSGLKASDMKQSDNFAGKTWAEILALTGYSDAAVKVTTRSVAMKNQIEYSVARLDVSVRALADKVEDGTTPTAKQINVNDLKVNGVLVGVQKTLGWDFTPKNANAFTIYDVLDAPAAITVNATDHGAAINYTLVPENEADKLVNIAVEFVNNGGSFAGADGQIIPNGGKFYLVGQMTAAAGKKVFEQDFVTKARFTINDLTKAYNLIPDLQVPELELGLSVNLEWQEGLTIDIDL